MFNHYELQQLMEAKKMEMHRQMEQRCGHHQIENSKKRLSLLKLFKKAFTNQPTSSDECCVNC